MSHVDERIICEADINCACKHLYNSPVGLLGVTVEHQYAAFFLLFDMVTYLFLHLGVTAELVACRQWGLRI